MLEKGQRRRYQHGRTIECPSQGVEDHEWKTYSTFGEVESGDKVLAPSIEGEMAGDGDGGQNRDDNGMDGIASGGSINSE